MLEEEREVAPCGASTDNKDAIPVFTTPCCLAHTVLKEGNTGNAHSSRNKVL